MSILRFVMALQNAFRHLLPTLYDDSDPDYIPAPLATSTAAAEESNMNNAFLDVLSDANKVLIDDAIPAITPELSDEEDSSDNGAVLSALEFFKGRNRGQQCSYNGYIYAHNKSQGNGHR